MSEQATTPTAADLQQALRAARQQAVEVTKAHTVATRAQLVLEQAVEAEAFLSSHAARVAALETRAEALGASIVSLETREAVAQKRLARRGVSKEGLDIDRYRIQPEPDRFRIGPYVPFRVVGTRRVEHAADGGDGDREAVG